MSELHSFLKRAGWKRRDDTWAARSGRAYVLVEETAPGDWDRSVIAFLAKAVLQAQARRKPHAETIAALHVRRASPLTDSRLAAFIEEVAPTQSWILHDAAGRLFPHVTSAPELQDTLPERPPRSEAPAARKQHSLFTDLNQWMLKVLLAPQLPERFLTAPRNRLPRNATMLAELADVSFAAANRFVHALAAEGQLDQRFGDLRIARPLELLRQWRDRIGHPARREIGVASVRGPFNLDSLAGIAAAFAKARSDRPPLVLGLSSACDALGLGHVRGAIPVAWTASIEDLEFEDLGLVTGVAGKQIDLVIRTPRYPESLFRGAVTPTTATVTDVIQCWLDTSHHRVRGAEQADFIWRKALVPAFS